MKSTKTKTIGLIFVMVISLSSCRSLSFLGDIYYERGNYAETETFYKNSLAMREKLLGPNNAEIALGLSNLGRVYREQGRYAEAEVLYKRSLTIMTKHHALMQPSEKAANAAVTQNELAILYNEQGRYAEAEILFKHVLEIQKKLSESDHPNVAASLHNLAALHGSQGRYAEAESFYKSALAIKENIYGRHHSEIAQTLNNLATLYHDKGNYAQAEALYKRALAIREKDLNPNHPDIARSLSSLAVNYQHQGKDAQAKPLHERALRMLEKTYGPDHSSVAIVLNRLGALYFNQGHYIQAEVLVKRSLTIWEKVHGPVHPLVAIGLHNLSKNAWMQGNTMRAVDLLKRAHGIREHHLKLLLIKGSEYEKRAYLATIDSDTHAAVSLDMAAGTSKPASTRLALTTLLQRKGRVLDALSHSFGSLRGRLEERERLLPVKFSLLKNQRTVQHMLTQLSSVNNQRAALYMLVRRAKISPEQFRDQIARLDNEAQALEAKISAVSVEFSELTRSITLEHVQQAIPIDAALLEFVVYRPFKPQAKNQQESLGVPHYAAYVLRSGGEPLSVDLGEADIIERLVGDLREGLANPDSVFVSLTARKLDEKVMRPVRKLLSDTRMILLSPDGVLNLVPFGALIDENNEYLIKHYAFTYLSSGRDLLRMQTKTKSRQPPTFVADVDFGPVGQIAHAGEIEENITNRRSTGLRTGEFNPLPGTAIEAQAIAKILPTVNLLTGQQATESMLKQLKGPQILHVATHGFFLPILPLEPKDEWDIQFEDDEELLHGPKTENPLLRSGLALANANQLKSEDEDGVLTALEAASLDLWGTKLVVLSACETGVGEVQNGEGVFGLRRALVIAGSESQVISLWKVADHATKDLMVDYYKQLISNKGRSEALRQAQLTMLNDQNRSHPFYWASFIPSGDWRPPEAN